jgi:ABC-type uncharacterized transport system substrate-binding protein
VDRRAFLAVSVHLLAMPFAVEAQPTVMPTIGFVRSSSLRGVETFVAGFRQGLKETGYVDGQNMVIEFRSADDHPEKLPVIFGELIRRPVAVLVANFSATQAAKAATMTVPIVFISGGDPVADDKLVSSFNRPGGNITGVTFLQLSEKKLQLLREVVPGAKVIGVLENPNVAASSSQRASVLTAAQAIGQQMLVVRATQERDFESAFASLARAHAGGLLVTGDALFTSRRDRLIALAARHAIPTIHSETLFVQAGALISYGADIPDAYRLAGIYTGRILRGEKPAELPVIQASKFALTVNLKTAKALGLTIPPAVLARADDLIQ